MQARKDMELYRERDHAVSWKVPVFCTNDWLAMRLSQICEELGAGKPFDIAYGCPQCAWEGGRPASIRHQLAPKEAERYFAAYADHGIKVALTLSRLEIEPVSLADPYCNMLLDLTEAYGGEAIVVDDALARHIRKTHPGIRLIASFNKPLCWLNPSATPKQETAYYTGLLDLYDEVVVRCEYALDDRRIGLFPAGRRDDIEVIVNQICVPGCTRGLDHMQALQNWNEGRVQGACQVCFNDKVSCSTARLNENLYVSNRRIGQLASMGVSKLKIGGRNAPVDRLLDYLATYIFEPTGMILAIRDVIAHEYGALRRSNPFFAQYMLP